MSNYLTEHASSLADQASETAGQALKSGQRLTSDALDSLTDSVNELRQQGVDAMHNGSRQIRRSVHQASACTKDYIRDEPVKSVLIAAAAGAVVMGLLSFAARPRQHD